ncbi:MAG: SigB/SigF/SigG family RNA polymerase sigma factor [Firmicutes bacterium]|nr:SigB/SigF/SigG family RNA polymerase sigma factor [Bacillota bacterium]
MARASEEKTRELFQEYQKTRSVELRNRIVELNLYLVEILIKKYMNKGVEKEDLYQVASMALVLAVERFDPERGFEFTSFATPTIIGEIKRHFRDKGWAMKVPRRLKELSVKLPEAREFLENKLGRTPKLSELAEHMEVSQEELLEAMESGKAYGAYSLQQTFEGDGDGEEAPALEKYASHHEAGYTAFENADFIRSVVAGFTEQERTVFRRRFLEEKTQQEIADELGVSQMSVSRMEKRLKEKFKEEFYR